MNSYFLKVMSNAISVTRETIREKFPDFEFPKEVHL